tara:strand:+ start:741 stop:842 length:102 start_codon:yes stop_codon:yes gene_type:complete
MIKVLAVKYEFTARGWYTKQKKETRGTKQGDFK